MPQTLAENYRELFKSETLEQLEKMLDILLSLPNNPEYEEKPIHELFRLAHNIKGASGMMKLESLKNAMHALETVLGEVREKKTCLNPDEIERIIQFGQTVTGYVSGDQWDSDEELQSWRQSLADLQKSNSGAPGSFDRPLTLSEMESNEIAAWQEAGKIVYGIEAAYIQGSLMKGASAFVFVKFLEKFGRIYKTVPAIENLATEDFNVFKTILFCENGIDEQAMTSYSGQDLQTVTVRKWVFRNRADKCKTVPEQQSPQDTIRVSFSKVDQLLRDVEEVSRLNTTLINIYNKGEKGLIAWHEIGGLIWQQEKLLRSLHVDALRLGMVSVKQLFSRFSLIVHEVAKKCGKQAEIKFIGEDTEIEKRMAERLIDPLTHLVRNAVDHGLEDGVTRLQRGKTEIGCVTLEARQEGESVVISVSDDGRGMNPEKIREKAVSKHLILENDRLSEAEIMRLVFAPGFSTAEQITDISGRGVGLDVVQNSVLELKGEIGIESRINQGTTFRLRIPQTQAVVNSFFVQIDDQIFGVPLENVVEITEINSDCILKSSQGLFYNWQDKDIPLIDLGDFFEIKPVAERNRIPILVLKEDWGIIGVLAEELIGHEKVMLKPLNPIMNHPLISGIATLSNGEAALLVDVQKMFNWEKDKTSSQADQQISGVIN